MIQIIDFLINALVSWRTRIFLARQKADMCCLDGKENPADAGFYSLNGGGQKENAMFPISGGRGSLAEPVYFPGFTEAELKAMVNQNKGQ